MRRGRWRSLPVALLATVLACIACMIWVDRPLALYMRANLPPDVLGFFRLITDLGKGTGWLLGGVAVAAGAIAAGAVCLRLETAAACLRLRNAALFYLVSILGSGLLVVTLKPLFGRLRPRFLYEQGLYGFAPFTFDYGSVTFPSGHAQTVFAAMTALAVLFPRFAVPFYATAAILAASRAITGVHYLSDVLFGSFLGVAVTLILAGRRDPRHLALTGAGRPGSLSGRL